MLDGILDPDGLDQLGKVGQMIAPATCSRQQGKEETIMLHGDVDIPFLGRDDLDDAGLHAILVNALDEFLKVAELIHCLPGSSVRSIKVVALRRACDWIEA